MEELFPPTGDSVDAALTYTRQRRAGDEHYLRPDRQQHHPGEEQRHETSVVLCNLCILNFNKAHFIYKFWLIYSSSSKGSASAECGEYFYRSRRYRFLHHRMVTDFKYELSDAGWFPSRVFIFLSWARGREGDWIERERIYVKCYIIRRLPNKRMRSGRGSNLIKEY